MNTGEYLMNSPFEVPFTEREHQKINNKALLMRGLAVFLVLLAGYIAIEILDKINEYGIEESTNGQPWLFGFELLSSLVIIVLTIKALFQKANDYETDTESSNKQVGIIQITQKHLERKGEYSHSCYVYFKWCNAHQSKEIMIDHWEMYCDLNEGDKAYFEFAPHSQHVIYFRKKYVSLP